VLGGNVASGGELPTGIAGHSTLRYVAYRNVTESQFPRAFARPYGPVLSSTERMPTYETSISIAAPREAVWRALADVAAWPEWLPTVSSVQPLDGRPLAVGHHYLVRQPGLQPVTWRVTELEAQRRFIWQGRSPGLVMLAEHIVDEDRPGTSSVVLRFS